MFDSFWQMLIRSFRSSVSVRSSRPRQRSALGLEALEARWMPNATTIAGFVYSDANGNGIQDPGETGLAAATVELFHSNGTLVATTTTDANGHYEFTSDPTISVTPKTEEVDATFPNTPTNWTSSQSVAQFNPALGTLTSVEIIQNGMLTTDVTTENAEPNAINVDVKVNGQFTLTGAGISSLVGTLATIDNQGTLNPYDGTDNFTGSDSMDFGSKQATASNSATYNAATTDLSAFIGTGQIQLTDQAVVSSQDTGTGNFDERIRSQAGAQVQIIYNYIPTNSLQPGDYYVEKTVDPPGNWTDGQTTDNNITPIPNSMGSNKINVTLPPSGSSLQNNFAELAPASISGTVYYDTNDAGKLEAGDPGLPGATLTLTGTNASGAAVNLTQTTDANGNYSFTNLVSGSYTITETTEPPGGYIDAKTTAGSQGGTASGLAISQITLGSGVTGVDNNFGKILPSSLAGYVYVDQNHNGMKVSSDPTLANVGVTLTGTDDQGNAVFQTTSTAADGSYSFSNLRPSAPGTQYTLSDTTPPGYLAEIDTPGSLGGSTANDQLFVSLGQDQNGANYNFGKVLPPPVIPNSPPPIPQSPPPTPLPPPPPTPLFVFNKIDLIDGAWRTWVAM